MSVLENLTSALVATLGAVALVTGVVTFSVAAIVFGSALVLAALWFRRSITQFARIDANTREMTRAVALLIRLQQGRKHEEDTSPASGPGLEP